MNSTKHAGNLEILLVVGFECCPPCRVLEDIQSTFTLCVGCRLNDISFRVKLDSLMESHGL